MKECNIPFCKEIPDTWKEVPNKYLFEYHSVKVGDKWKDYQLLSLTTGGVKEKDINASGGKVPDSYDKYQTVEPGDMIFCLFDLDVSAVFSGLSHHYGMITSAYEVVRPNHKILDQYFSNFWFQYVFTNRYYKMYSKNIRFTIGSDMFKVISTPIPPMDQQRKIAGFLNKKTAEIDSLIEIENQQIEKLKEYKQAVITEAVTKGLDKNATMKDSGVDWIGKIPEGWQVVTTKSIFEVIAGATPDSGKEENWDGDISWITPADYKTEDVFVNSGRRNLSQKGYDSCSTSLIPVGNIIFSKRAPIGLVAINNKELCTNQGCLSCIKKKDVSVKYFYYQMSVYTEYYELFGSGTTFKEISAQKFGAFKLALPQKNVQEDITNYLDGKCDDIAKLIEIKQQKIDQLGEYKKSLIYEYVTGKKEVIV